METKEYLKTDEGKELVKDFRKELIKVWAAKDMAKTIIHELTPHIESKYKIRPDSGTFAEYFLMSYIDKYNLPLNYDSIVSGAIKYAETLAAKLQQGNKKPCKSINRAYGIALALAYYNGKIDYEDWLSLRKRIEIVKGMGIKNCGTVAAKNAANFYQTGRDPGNENYIIRAKEDYPEDYKYAEHIYENCWPD